MFSHLFVNLVARLLRSRWTRDRTEHHSPCEDSLTGRLGPLLLDENGCFVLDHEDAGLTLCVPTLHWRDGRLRRGTLQVGFRACLGTEQIRRTGFERLWIKPLPRDPYAGIVIDPESEFPF